MTAEAFIKDKLIPWLLASITDGANASAGTEAGVVANLATRDTLYTVHRFIEQHKTEWQEGGE